MSKNLLLKINNNDKKMIPRPLFCPLKRDYIKNGMHHSGMWGCQEGQNPKLQSLCSKNEAAQAPTPLNDEFCIKWQIIE